MIIPKKIHLTCKDKNNIDNRIWKECLQKYRLLYHDYEIIIYDNEDIYNNKHLELHHRNNQVRQQLHSYCRTCFYL